MNAGSDAPQARRRLPPEARTPQILRAALEEFAERGYAGARMAAVASRAGIAKGLIYHYFPSKEALFQATVHACTRPVFEEAERQLAGHAGPARDLLGSLVRIGYARIGADRQERILFRLIITEAERFPDLARFYRDEMLARATGIARAVLRAGVAAGEFRPEVADMPGLAEVVLAPVLMASVWRMILGETEAPAPESLRDAHLDLLLRGLSA
ncbi:TetR/AcrR family transcriptional regulator [Roseomonas sp. M0104]|uniref:TetR/AcrR family transcriptional regulator n=1 Tax=Teichococcus coralli TaxID=2545983 RepID=A0A845BCS2_9PROT|nr:TetR/AcrR family transcriptional regulator [Pseudoroseomonas coralli]MXP64508.1 TetR/AcrR family transcriptional regulator [Pseudoroseomonas coralli]